MFLDDPALPEEPAHSRKKERIIISRSTSPTFSKQTNRGSWSNFNSLGQFFTDKTQSTTPELKSPKNCTSGPTFTTEEVNNKTPSPPTDKCLTVKTSLEPCPPSETIMSSIKMDDQSKLPSYEEALDSDTESPAENEEPVHSASSRPVEAEVEDDSIYFTPELYDPVDTEEDGSELVESDEDSTLANNSN